MAQTTTATWQETAKAKRESLIALLPAKYNIDTSQYENERDVTGVPAKLLSQRDLEITETDAEAIVDKTSTGQWTAVEVTTAFINRASIAHKLVSCLLEVFFDAALEDAKALDEYYAKHGKPKGPLHGLPISLKDQFHVKGVETSMGYVGWIGTFQGKKGTGKEKVFESEFVRELRNLGAVLYCKTTVPHTLMTGESINNIHGAICMNPKNRALVAGGSSGGEGALLSLRGSPLGLGTDIGGSIRIPAAFNGLFGLRPSSGRLPYEGMANSMDGQNTILSVVGPLSPSLGGIRLLMKAALSQQPWLYDPMVNEIPWRPDHEKQIQDIIGASSGPKLAFGLLRLDGAVTPHPPVARAVDMVVKAVKEAGHQIIDWNPPSHEEGVSVLFKTWVFDGGKDIFDSLELSGEPTDNDPTVNMMFPSRAEEKTASHIAEVNVFKREYQKRYMDYWNSTAKLTESGRPVDALIMPLAPFSAPKPKRFLYYNYSGIINVLDYPSCILPVTNVDKSVDLQDKAFKPVSDLDQMVHDDYDPELYDGAHVGVQVVGRRLNEEKLLAVVSEAERALKTSKQ